MDRPEIADGEALAGLLRPGNAGSNTAADHITVLGWALESLPGPYRPDPDDPGAQQILVRCDSAGATHGFAETCRARGVGYSFGVTSQVSAGSQGRPSASMTRVSKKCLPCFAAVER